jgi:hypothetical protein
MGQTNIRQCRICKSDKLGDAFGVDSKFYYVFCKICKTLQRKDDMLYEINFDFSTGRVAVPYYPIFLDKHDTEPLTEDRCLYFSLSSIEYLLNACGYEVLQAEVNGYDLLVDFKPLTKLDKIRRFEKRKKLDNQYTFMLWAMQLKK